MSESATKIVILSSDSITKTTDMKTSPVINDKSSGKGQAIMETLTSQSPIELSTPDTFSSLPLLQSSYDRITGSQDKSLQSMMTRFISMSSSSNQPTSLPDASLKTDIAGSSQTVSHLPKVASQTTPSPTKYISLSSSAKISKSPSLAASAMRQIQAASLPSSKLSSDIVMSSLKSSSLSSPIFKDLSSSDAFTDKLSVSNHLTSVQKRSADHDLSVSLTSSYSPETSKSPNSASCDFTSCTD
ncbi:serine-rich adhesin for platelets-like [Pecten maximus]|uniref:serine-rich adhesin for platelets-like n=1 Tax=Pecten maximus TaxID=6579 RepID=UPI001458B87D|nr:serine-rich adhesin for platelets-like [Pecten maximus]